MYKYLHQVEYKKCDWRKNQNKHFINEKIKGNNKFRDFLMYQTQMFEYWCHRGNDEEKITPSKCS